MGPRTRRTCRGVVVGTALAGHLATAGCTVTAAPEFADPALSRAPIAVEPAPEAARRAACVEEAAGLCRAVGSVTASGTHAPVGHAAVAVWEPRSDRWTPRVVTDDRGEFALDVPCASVVGVLGFPVEEQCAASERLDFTVHAPSATDLAFVDEGGAPLAGFEVLMIGLTPTPQPTGVLTDAAGTARIAYMGPAVPGVPSFRLDHPQLAALGASGGTVVMSPGRVFEGTIIASDTGAPVAGAAVALEMVFTGTSNEFGGYADQRGGYRFVAVDTGNPFEILTASAPGYRDQAWGRLFRLTERDDALYRVGEAGLDFVLEPVREIQLRCAGLPQELCRARCVDSTGRASERRGPSGAERPAPASTVACPLHTDGLVYGGGRSVRVGPDEQVAWLDFRDLGGGLHLALPDGAACSAVSASRSPFGRVTLPCDSGRTTFEHLPSGTWALSIAYRPEGSEVDLVHQATVHIADEVVDVPLPSVSR